MVAPGAKARYRRPVRRICLLVAAFVLAPPAAAATREGAIPFVPASRGNYHPAHRGPKAIRLVVVHTAEGTYGSTIAWFRNPRARSSAHYVVGRDGRITQMVSTWNVAWHAGNAWVNAHSIGIEHEGFTNVPALYTDLQYRASARLVASVLRRSHLRPDRRHVIGHAEVPDPYHRGEFGGYSHHTDPGAYWDWARYMAYVRSYAAGIEPPPLAFDLTVTSPSLLQRVSDAVSWTVMPEGLSPVEVDFVVDGHPVAALKAEPWQWSWDSYAVPNGRHVLTAHAVTADARVADASIVVVSQNVPIAIPDTSPSGGEILRGVVRWTASVRGRPDRVEFLVDGTVRDTQNAPPYAWEAWDTSAETEGPHVLGVRAVRREKVVASRTFDVVVVR
jgi:hypothetical protein